MKHFINFLYALSKSNFGSKFFALMLSRILAHQPKGSISPVKMPSDYHSHNSITPRGGKFFVANRFSLRNSSASFSS